MKSPDNQDIVNIVLSEGQILYETANTPYVQTPTGFAKHKLPPMSTSGQVIGPGDYDHDGDLDLFVGGRVVPGHYPNPPRSYLLKNVGGKDTALRYVDATATDVPKLRQMGLVPSSQCTDFDCDGCTDLIVAGEWMPLRFFKNTSGHLTDVSAKTGLTNTEGWW